MVSPIGEVKFVIAIIKVTSDIDNITKPETYFATPSLFMYLNTIITIIAESIQNNGTLRTLSILLVIIFKIVFIFTPLYISTYIIIAYRQSFSFKF